MFVYLVWCNDHLVRVFREQHGQKAVDLLHEQMGRHGGGFVRSKYRDADPFVQRWHQPEGSVARMAVEKEEAE